jgi:excisionase family DNA binding protein
MEETILTVDQVAQILQVHPFTVLKFIKQGRLKAAKLGRVYRIKRSDVDAFLEEQSGPPKKKGPKPVEKKISVEIKDISGNSSLTNESKEAAFKKRETPRQIDDDHYIIDFTT